MKRIWFGAALLGLLLILGILSTALMEDTHLTQAAQLDRAGELAAAGNWKGAEIAFFEAKALWEKRNSIIAGLSDHEPMDQIESCFAQLEVFLKMRDPVSFCGSCRYLSKQLEALGQSHSFNLQNFF